MLNDQALNLPHNADMLDSQADTRAVTEQESKDDDSGVVRAYFAGKGAPRTLVHDDMGSLTS